MTKHAVKDTSLVKIEVTDGGDDLLRRVEVLNSTLFRILQEGTLIRVKSADYRNGCVELIMATEPGVPRLVPGSVAITIHKMDENGEAGSVVRHLAAAN